MYGIKGISLSFLFVSVIQCNMNRIYDSSTSASPTFHIHARKLLELCFPNELNPVVISVDLIHLMDELQRNEAINSSILTIDEDFSSKVIQKYYPRHPSYLITTNSMKILRNTLREIKLSKIWNVASVIVGVGKDCDRAEKILKEIWKIEAIHSFYVCQHKSTNESFVFTFNPYTSHAPEQWRRIGVADHTDDRWTLYSQPFRDEQTICPSVTFDRTRSLDGYPFKGVNIGKEDRVSEGIENLEKAFSVASRGEEYLFTELLMALNVTPVIHTVNGASTNLTLLYESLNNGTYDMPLEYKIRVNDEYLDFIPLYVQGGYLLITKKKSTIPVLTEVADNFFSFPIMAMSAFTLFIIFIMILMSYQYDFSAAALDIISLVLGMGISTPMTRLFIRVTFFSATLFGFFLCPELQSQLTSVLTSPEPQKNVETLQELYDNQYQVFYHPFAGKPLKDSKIWGNSTFKGFENFTLTLKSCTRKLQKNSVACILPNHLLDNITISDLHISKESFFKKYNWLTMRKNFPLKSKIDKTAMNLFEAGFVDYLERKNPVKRYMKKQKLIDRIEALEQEEFLDLTDFSFFLWRFAFVVFFSLFVALIEFAVYKLKKYYEKRARKSEIEKPKNLEADRESR